MGAFARTGIIVKFSIDVSDLKDYNQDIKKAATNMARNVIENPEIFDACQEGEDYTWKLKKDIRTQLLPKFLKRFYNDFYEEGSMHYTRECKPILDFLKTNPSEIQLKNWVKKNWNNTFYMYDSDTIDFFFNNKRIFIETSSIRLSYEGKVSYEEFEDHIRFFEKAIRKAYADNPLGGCLTFTIS